MIGKSQLRMTEQSKVVARFVKQLKNLNYEKGIKVTY